ncbi:hypothetical protein NBRC116494_18590 [Aurantivibrio plasticivorans]
MFHGKFFRAVDNFHTHTPPSFRYKRIVIDYFYPLLLPAIMRAPGVERLALAINRGKRTQPGIPSRNLGLTKCQS